MELFKVTLLQSNISFYYDNSISLLDVILRQQINHEYGCKHGFCGSCYVKIIKGNFYYEHEPIAFIPNECILLCCVKLKSDIILDM